MKTTADDPFYRAVQDEKVAKSFYRTAQVILEDMLSMGKTKLYVYTQNEELGLAFSEFWNLSLVNSLASEKNFGHKERIRQLINEPTYFTLTAPKHVENVAYVANIDLLVRADGSPRLKNL